MRTKSKTAAFRIRVLVAAVNLAFAGSTAWAQLPTGLQLVTGSGTVSTIGNTMTVTSSPNSIFNAQTFSIGQVNTFNSIQQSAQSSVMFRVLGGQMSEIMGRLRSNGQVFLINPAGILVGAGAVIDTASFYGSTLQILDKDFLAGKLNFQAGTSAGKITNQGWIRTGYGGHVVLMAPTVENSGLIEAPGGQIMLAAGRKITISSLDHDGISFEVQAPADSALNIGKLIADGGSVKMFAGTLKHSGEIRANSLVLNTAGEIVLKAKGDIELSAGSSTVANGKTGGAITIESATGTTRVAGSISATGSAGAGGHIDVLGDKVVIGNRDKPTDSVVLDASGATAGGSLRIGGDWQGANPGVRNAQSTFVYAGATLKADATDTGDGGKVVVWADGDTRFFGSLSARGGPKGGNGGSAEVSGKGDLLFVGGADLGAPKGSAGSLLLDPLDLFIDTAGGLNPDIINEATDFPNNAATVSPATLTAINGNVTLYASRDLRFNNAVSLTGAGQGLTAFAGRNLQLGAAITTAGGAVSLTAAQAMTTFGAPSITTAGGNVALSAQSISAGSMNVNAGAGAVSAVSSAGSTSLGAVAGGAGISLSSSGGGLSVSSTTTTGGAVNLNSSSSVFVSSVITGGGALTAQAGSGNVQFSNIDTRLSGGPTGGAVTLTASSSSVFPGAVQAGNANINLSGTSVFTSTMTTTGNVGMTASAGSISATVNDAANITATANSPFNTSVNLSSTSTTTPLNATSISATAPNSATISLSGNKGVNVGTVTATASSFPSFFSGEPVQFDFINETVNINGQTGSILAMGPASQVTAANVTLQTNALSGGGIGSAATALNVNAERSFIFRPNGDFNVALNGTGPNVLNLQPGVAPTGLTYTGALTKGGQINLTATANDTTVTVGNFSVTSGFDDLVFNTSPSITLNVPNGSLVVNNASFPVGDQTGRIPPFSGTNVIQALPVTFSAFNNLTVNNYARSSGVKPDTTTFSTTSGSTGSITLGTVNADKDTVNISAPVDVTITGGLSTAGNVNITAATGPTDTGNVTIGGLGINTASGTGNINITALSALAGQGEVRAGTDSAPLEITSGGNVNITAKTIGTSGFANPLDLAAPSVTFNTSNIQVGTALPTTIGSSSGAVVANTTSLTIIAAACNTISGGLCSSSFRGGTFNVNTGSVALQNLTVTADPLLVGSGGLAKVASNGQTYTFNSDGANFATSPIVSLAAGPGGGQFAGGSLSFTSLRGNLTLGNVDLSPTNGGLTMRTNGNVANLSQAGPDAINLGTGALQLLADGNVSVQAINAGSMSVSNATSTNGSGGSVINGFFQTGVSSFTTNGNAISDTGAFGGNFSVASRGAVTTAALDVSNVSFSAVLGGITTSTIGSASKPANSVTLSTNFNGGVGSISTGAVEANSANFVTQTGNITSGGAAFNANNPGASSVTLTANSGAISVGNVDASNVNIGASGAVTTANINPQAATTFPSSITLRSNTSITTGTLDADSINAGSFDCCSSPAITTGAIGGNLAGNSLSMSGSNISIGGNVLLDPLGSGQLLKITAGGDLTIAGNVSAGQVGSSVADRLELSAGNLFTFNGGSGTVTTADASFIALRAGNTNTATPLAFARVNGGIDGISGASNSDVLIDAPAGIRQTGTGVNDGITAGTVTLKANSFGSAIDRSGGTQFELRETTNLTLETVGDTSIRLTGAAGAPQLTNLDITRGKNDGAFLLNNGTANQLNGAQNLTVTDNGSGVNVTLGASGQALNFRYRNTDGSGNIVGLGIASNGGQVRLESASSGITTGNIDSTNGPGTGGFIYLSANTGINVSGTVNAGSSSIDAITGGNLSKSGSGSLTASFVTGTSVFGDIGSSGTHLAISASGVSLNASRNLGPGIGGDVFADLTGAAGVTLNADHGFNVASNTALNFLAITTRGDQAGPTIVTAPTQSFSLARNGVALDIGNVVSTTPLSSFSATLNQGNLRVIGSGASSIAADSLSLTTTGNLTLDGSTSRVVLNSSNSQNFVANGNVLVDGQATLTTAGNQSFQTLSTGGDVVFQASGGSIAASAADQTLSAVHDVRLQAGGAAGDSIALNASNSQSFSAGNAIRLLGGAGNGASVTANGANQSLTSSGLIDLLGGTGTSASVTLAMTGNGNQTLSANGGNLTFAAGTGTLSSVTVSANGVGTQDIRAIGNIAFTGGGTLLANTDAAVSVTKDGNNTQLIYATGAISFNGGDGANGSVTVRNNGGGQQLIGDPCTLGPFNCWNTDSLTVQGGKGQNSFALVEANGRQLIRPINFVNVLGGDGSGAYARIRGNLSTSNSTALFNASQVIGYDTSVDGFGSFVAQLGSVKVAAGIGLNAYAEISAAGSQRVRATTSLGVVGSTADGGFGRITGLSQYINTNDMASLADRGLRAGTGNGANATIEATGTDADIVSGQQFLQRMFAGNLTLDGKGVAGTATAASRIASGGRQSISAGNTALNAGVGAASDASITSASTFTSQSFPGPAQNLSVSNLTLTGGGAVGPSPTTAKAEVISAGSQTINGSAITLNGGIGQNSWARIESGAVQSVSFGSLTMRGGGATGTPSVGVATPGATALVRSLAGGQSISGSTITLQGGIGTAGGAANDASAMIVNTTGNQSISGNTTIRSGADYAPAGIVNASGAGTQTFTSGSITIGTTAGANNLDAPIGGGHYAGIFQTGSGTQSLSGSSITIDNVDAPGQIGIVASGAQILTRFGSPITVQNSNPTGTAKITAVGTQSVSAGNLTVTSSGTAGEAKIIAGGDQSFSDSGLMTVQVSVGGGTAQIANSSGNQVLTSSNGLRVQASGGSGSASITSAGTQSVVAAFVDVNTGTSATGNALLTAPGNQSIHTTNGTLSGVGSVNVVALGSGAATIQSGGNQLIEADYPEVMQQSVLGNRDGRITVGSLSSLGTSLISGVNQDIFARSITVSGGINPGTIVLPSGLIGANASAKIGASGAQTISILTPGPLPAGITVQAGAGGSALIDPVVQTILSDAPIKVLGGTGPGTIAGILSSDSQTILSTGTTLANDILVKGGTGNNAFALISTDGLVQKIGTSGGIDLQTGTGANSDGVLLANPLGTNFFACGTGICNIPKLTAFPLTNTVSEFGSFPNPVNVPLSEIISPSSGGTSVPAFVSPFDPSLLMTFSTIDLTIDEGSDILFGRKLPICR